ncbi:HPr-rel-A system PqqD family peptide chaperone [Sphingomonas sp. SUN039]|uniref:HPr-rel-A system PqqD family peptide chaperone n=1 Tax=Sphingomonas sp. SUN039 TaxID=2937787 RepID=UPI0021643DB2|nr:HPr-rel-A system PqqD family peptide chaperone [Sphingomonas sp. SUN039]UVO54081.1 HPr-rel-A system PqqD family peptide chaperone [Sphingomonas sp. SUN039]
MKFRAPPDGVLRLVRLDAMTAIFDRRSGATHLVAEAVPTILAALAKGEADVAALAHRLGTDERLALSARLNELATTGLVERV